MLLDLIAAFAFAFLAAGCVMIARWLTAGRLPASLIPVAAGIGMLGYAMWSEHSWFDRQQAALPSRFAVILTGQSSSWYRPWTYAVPVNERFIAADLGGLKRNEAVQGQVMLELLLRARWTPDVLVPVVVDCREKRRADLVDGVEMDAQGRLIGADWRALPDDDALLVRVCQAM